MAVETARAIVVAGGNSGCGKTTVALAIMAAFTRRGLTVQPFKAGPDYIDPSLHEVVGHAPSINLDTWMMPERFLKRTFAERASHAGLSIIEGVMGLHDGKSPESSEGSTAELACLLGVPVLLVVNVGSMARTVAAVINGITEFDRRINFAGVILNGAGSVRHYEMLKKSVEKYCGLPVAGWLPKSSEIEMPSRHLGLHMGSEDVLDDHMLDRLAAIALDNFNLDLIYERAATIIQYDENASIEVTKKGIVAIAYDRAFCFYYHDNIDLLRQMEWEVKYFSPINDTELPDADAYYFGGGYPELHATRLSANVDMRNQIWQKSRDGAVIYAECGGLMYLASELTTADGASYPMCGCFDFSTKMNTGLRSLGYVEITPKSDWWILKSDASVRGHCFHYSGIVDSTAGYENFYSGQPAGKAVAFRTRNTVASYVHLHFSGLAGDFSIKDNLC